MRDWEAYVRSRLPLAFDVSPRADRIVRELAAQLQDFYRDALDRGLGPEEADAHARAQVSDWERLASDVRRADRPLAAPLRGWIRRLDAASDTPPRRWTMMAGAWQDLRYAIRQFARHPGLPAVAVLTLAVGIGANTAMFGVLRGVLLRPLPYPEPARLVRVFEIVPQYGRFSVAPAVFLDWRNEAATFEGLAAYNSGSATLSDGMTAERVAGATVSWDLFDVLRVRPALGRGFAPDEDGQPATAVVLSYGLWQRRFGGDPRVLGRSLTLNGAPVTVIGVMPAAFRFPTRQTELWIPLGINPADASRGGHYLSVIARLKPERSIEEAAAEMRGIAERLALEYPESSAGESAGVVLLHEDTVGTARRPLITLLAAVALVVLIACGNVANLLLVRASGAAREIAIRRALGALTSRVVRQMLTESLLVSVTGGVLGVALAYASLTPIRALSADSLPRVDDITIDGSVLVFALGLSLLTGLLFGAAPAWRAAHAGFGAALKEGGRSIAGSGGHGLRGLVVIAEVAVSLMLLVGAGLLMRSFANLAAVDPGFETDRVLTFRVSLPPAPDSDVQRVAYFGELLDRLEALPSVDAVVMTQQLPLQGRYVLSVTFQGRPELPPAERPSANYRAVTAGYFDALGIGLRRGRHFTERDAGGAPLVAIVDDAFASRHFPGEDPIGRGIDIGNGTDGFVEIVGVVGNVRHEGLDTAAEPTMYVPYAQDPLPSMAVLVRSAGHPLDLVPAVRAIAQEIDRGVPLFAVGALADVVGDSIAPRRFSMILLGLFAVIALFLAAVGLYGVLSYAVTQRTHEIGVRLAVGATPPRVLGLVVGQGVKLTLVGIAVGAAGALGLSRLVQTMLFGVDAFDPLTYAGTALTLLAVGVLACCLPARRAMRVDPILALRSD